MCGSDCAIEKVGIGKALFRRRRRNTRFGLQSETALFDPPIRLRKNRPQVRIVRATENVRFSPAPRYTFSRGDELSYDNQIHPGNEHFLPKVMVDFFWSSECCSTLYTNIPENYFFPNVGGTILTPFKPHSRLGEKWLGNRVELSPDQVCGCKRINKPFSRAAFESPWDLRGRTFPAYSKMQKMTKIRAKNRVWDVTGSFKMRETHP